MPEKKRFAPPFEVGTKLVAACCGSSSPAALRDRAMIVLALRTGVRREGLAELRIEDVDASAIVVILKGGRRHRIVLDSEGSSALSVWLRWLATKKLTDGFVFRSLRRGIRGWIVGTRLHVSSINRIFNKLAERSVSDAEAESEAEAGSEADAGKRPRGRGPAAYCWASL